MKNYKSLIALLALVAPIIVFGQPAKYIKVDGIQYRIVREADESSTFGLVSVAPLDYGHYEDDITIPNAIKESGDEYADTYKVIGIDEMAFAECRDLGVVTLSPSIETIGEKAFYCAKIESIIIPYGNLTSISDRAFYICSIKHVYLPESVKQIGYQSFASGGLESFEATGLKEVGEEALAYNMNLKSVTFGNGLEKINDNAFTRCKHMVSVNLPESLRSIGASAFSECEDLRSIAIPSGVKEIKSWAFRSSGVESIAIPEGLSKLENGVFSFCENLSSVIVPDNVKRLGDLVFNCCRKLKSVVLPAGVKSIGDMSFAQCKSLESVTIKAEIPPTFTVEDQILLEMGEKIDIFKNSNPSLLIFVPKSSLESYSSVDGWFQYMDKIKPLTK